jgi:hypothetical protein
VTRLTGDEAVVNGRDEVAGRSEAEASQRPCFLSAFAGQSFDRLSQASFRQVPGQTDKRYKGSQQRAFQ